ncbi:hypothetical protein [Mesorhizobium sp. BH1-1-5]|nr:hypothetical protein [Mesorhizobium sp. BH1-1-5]
MSAERVLAASRQERQQAATLLSGAAGRRSGRLIDLALLFG